MYTKGDTIDTFSIEYDNVFLNPLGESRIATVTGTPGAGFNFVIIKYGEIGATSVTDTTYDFSSNLFTAGATTSGNLTVPASGIYTTTINFPLVSANDSYGFDISKVGDTTLAATVPQATPDIILYQYYTDLTIAIGVDSPIHKIGGSGEDRYAAMPTSVTTTMQAGENIGEGGRSQTTYVSFSLEVDTADDFVYGTLSDELRRGDISNTASDVNGGTEISFQKLLATRNSTTKMTYSGVVTIKQAGNTNVTCLINVDQIIIPDN